MAMSHFPKLDSMLDCEMQISDFREAGSAARKDVLMPKASLLMTGLPDEGDTATAAETCGDGACSLHCLWGSVIPSPAGNMYFCEDARQKLCNAMPVEENHVAKRSKTFER